jgi:regulator of sigma E protease
MIVLAIFLILIMIHEFGHFIVAKKVGVRVEKFSLGFGPVLAKKKKSETEYSISLIPLGGYVKLAGDNLEEYKGEPHEFLAKSPSSRAAIIFCGPLLNYVWGIMLFWLLFCIGYPMFTTKVGGVQKNMGAIEAGITAGDKILSVDGKKVEFWEDLQKSIHVKQNDSVAHLSVLRQGKEFEVDVKIKTRDYTDPLGGTHKVGLLGISMGEEIVHVKYSFFKSFFLGVNKSWELTTATYMGLWRMITGKLSVRESMTGPVGIFYKGSQIASMGIVATLYFMAVLSISLAIFNLLPLPILDGGHLFLLAVEKVRGKCLGIKTERIISQIGVVLIIALVVFVTCNDIINFFLKR